MSHTYLVPVVDMKAVLPLPTSYMSVDQSNNQSELPAILTVFLVVIATNLYYVTNVFVH